MTDQQQFGSPVLILGESHANAMVRALEAGADEDFVAIDVRNKANPASGGKTDFNSFANHRPRHLVLAFGGTEHNMIGLIETDPKFDLVWPPYETVEAGRTLVLSSVIEELVAWRLRKSLQRAMAVRARFDCPVHALAPPPPFAEIDDLGRLPGAFLPFMESGIAPPSVRRKLYAVQCSVMRQAYLEHDIRLISAPPASVDENGFLRRPLWNRDPTHGNAAYGRCVLEHLREELHV